MRTKLTGIQGISGDLVRATHGSFRFKDGHIRGAFESAIVWVMGLGYSWAVLVQFACMVVFQGHRKLIVSYSMERFYKRR